VSMLANTVTRDESPTVERTQKTAVGICDNEYILRKLCGLFHHNLMKLWQRSHKERSTNLRSDHTQPRCFDFSSALFTLYLSHYTPFHLPLNPHPYPAPPSIYTQCPLSRFVIFLSTSSHRATTWPAC